MELKSLYSAFIAIFIAFSAVSCDDDVNDIGKTIQPHSDNISFEIDSIAITAKTTPFKDYIFIDNEKILLGEINDPIFGNLKADVLTEFYAGGSTNATFKLGYDDEATIDSVRLEFEFEESSFMGNKKKPMTISVYELTKELDTYNYTNVDPSKYCDMKTILGQRFFSYNNLVTTDYTNSNTDITTTFVTLDIELDKSYGERLYQMWKENKEILNSSEALKEFTKGIYITTDFNDNGIFDLSDINATTATVIYYSYKEKLKKVNEPDVDSIVTREGVVPLTMGYNAKKLNRVVNTSWDDIKNIAGNSNFEERTLVKAPAGVITEVTIPLGKIKEKGKDKMKDENFSVNSALFKLTGFTEEENELNISKRPDYLLFINKDSIANFFSDKKSPDYITSMVMSRNTDNNTYEFSSQGIITASYITNNISSTINHYLKEDPDKEELQFLVIPIAASLTGSVNSYFQIDNIENLLQPAAAIFRTDEKNMVMSLAFGRHNDIE